MKPIEQKLALVTHQKEDIELSQDPNLARTSKGFEVTRFHDLTVYIARLSYWNPQFNLLFRGENNLHCYTKGGRISLLPTILRAQKIVKRQL